MLHVLVGSNDLDHQTLIEAGLSSVAWIVPKKSAVGDRAILFTRAAGFVAFARIASLPEKTMFGGRHAYEAQVDNVNLLQVPVSLEDVAAQLPQWAWTIYPRSYTTIRDSALVAQLEAVVEAHQPPPTGGALPGAA